MTRRNQNDDITGPHKVWPKIADAVEERFAAQHAATADGRSEAGAALAPLEIDEMVDLPDCAVLPRGGAAADLASESDKDLILRDVDDLPELDDGHGWKLHDVIVSSVHGEPLDELDASEWQDDWDTPA